MLVTPAGLGAEAGFHVYLREELAARGWGVRQLAEALDVRFGVVARWVSDNPDVRVLPKARTLVRIAQTLDLDAYEVFRRAGYLPEVESVDGSYTPHPHEAEVRILVNRFFRTLRSTHQLSDAQWSLAAIIIATQLENLQLLLDRLEEQLPH